MIAIEKARDLLAAHDFIEFALLFGSFARGKPKPWSDVDIAIFVARPLDLLEIGQLTAALECSLGRAVDVLVLNTALEHHPALAYNVVAEGSLLFCRRRGNVRKLQDPDHTALSRYGVPAVNGCTRL